MSTTETYRLETLVDMASAKLNRRGKRRFRRRLERNEEYRETFYDEIEPHLCRNCGVSAVMEVSREAFAAQSGCDGCDVQFGIDSEKLKEFLDVIADFIINTLPKILEVLLPLFMSLLFMLTVVIPANASAQHVGCEGRIRDTANLPLYEPELVEQGQSESVESLVFEPACETATMSADELEYSLIITGEVLAPETTVSFEVSESIPDNVLAQFAEEDCPGGICPVPEPQPAAETAEPPTKVQYVASQLRDTDGIPILGPGTYCPDCGNTYEANQAMYGALVSSQPRYGYRPWQPVRNVARLTLNRQPVRNTVAAPFRLAGAMMRNKPVRRMVANWRYRRAARVASRVSNRWN